VLGSIIGALASNFSVLLGGRIIQAFGTGMLIPIGMNLTLEVAPKEKLGIYMGIMGAMTTLGPSLSVILAGVLLTFFSWHMLLWTFSGLSFLLFLSGIFFLGDIAKLTHPKLDVRSVAFIGLALIGILYGISTAFSGSIGIAVVTALVGVLFLFFFVKRQGSLSEPLINLQPLSSGIFSLGIILNMIALIVIFAMNIVLPIYLQGALGASSFAASLALFPAIILSCVIAPVAGKIYDRHGANKLLPLGFALIFVFTIALALSKDTGSLVLIAILYIPVICGSALIIGPVQSFALSHLRQELNPHGVTVMSTGFQIAGCIGASLFTGAYFAMRSSGLNARLLPLAASNNAFVLSSLLAAAFALIGVVLALYLQKTKSESKESIHVGATLAMLMKTEVYTVNADASIMDALKLISGWKVSGVPVVDGSQNLVGFISDGDIVRYLAKSHPLFENAYSFAAANSWEQEFDTKLKDLATVKVRALAHQQVITVNIDDDLSEVCHILGEHRLKKAPVLENGKLVGIINASNIMHFVLRG